MREVYAELRLAATEAKSRIVGLHGSYPETGFEEISGDLLQADFWTARMSAPILTPAHDNVLYHSLRS